jgi:parvulin-like peptidyl-prolyl isomerase
MKLSRVTLVVLAAGLALVASSCGGSEDVPNGAVATVDGTVIAKSELDQLMTVARKSYESRDQEFPNAGTPEYQSVQSQYLAFLVQREEFRKEAEELGVAVTEKDIDEKLEEIVERNFDGDRKKLDEALGEQGFTFEIFRDTALESSALSDKLFEAVTEDVEVTDADVLLFYTQNQAQYSTPESRDVRHILVSEKDADDKVDFAASEAEADRIYAELRGGADFAALAKAESDDPGSKDQGGKLTIRRGETVPPFDKTAFALERGELSRPVKTTFGYHVIEALTAVRPATTQKLEEVEESIRQQLLQERKNETMTEWVEDLRERYEGKVTYAVGFEPPDLPEAPTETE